MQVSGFRKVIDGLPPARFSAYLSFESCCFRAVSPPGHSVVENSRPECMRDRFRVELERECSLSLCLSFGGPPRGATFVLARLVGAAVCHFVVCVMINVIATVLPLTFSRRPFYHHEGVICCHRELRPAARGRLLPPSVIWAFAIPPRRRPSSCAPVFRMVAPPPPPPPTQSRVRGECLLCGRCRPEGD